MPTPIQLLMIVDDLAANLLEADQELKGLSVPLPSALQAAITRTNHLKGKLIVECREKYGEM